MFLMGMENMKVIGDIVISLEDVKIIFQDLIVEKMTREEAHDWAISLMHLEDAGKLVYKNRNEEKRIWDAIMSLTGADTPTTDRPYLFDADDFRKWLQELLKKE